MKAEELMIKLFFWFVLLPFIIIAIPFCFVYEVINNLKRGILFDLS